MANTQAIGARGEGGGASGTAATVEFTVMIFACGQVPAGSLASGGLVYAIAVTQPVQSWTVLRSHEDFQSLDQALSQLLTGLPPCPGPPAIDDRKGDYLATVVQARNELQHWLSAILMYPGARDSPAVRSFLTVAANTIPLRYEGVAWTQFNTAVIPSPHAQTPPPPHPHGNGSHAAGGTSAAQSSYGGNTTTSARQPHGDAVATVASNHSSPAVSHVHHVDDMEMDDMFLVEDDDDAHATDDDDDDDEDYIPAASERYKPTDEAVTEDDEIAMMNELAGGEVEMIEDIGSLAQSLGASHLGRSLQLQAETGILANNHRVNSPQQAPAPQQQGLNVGGQPSRSGAAHQQRRDNPVGGIGGIMARAASNNANPEGPAVGFSDSFNQRLPQSAPRLDSFRMIKVIGKGSFGKVFLVKEIKTGQIYALKVLRKDNIIKRNQVEHTKTERSVLGYVKHPFIVGLNMAFQSKDKLYFVLDYCAGGELFFHLGRLGRFPEPRARFYAAEIVLAISYVHSLDIVYRDLKPENVLLDSQGHIRLTDFGLSKEGISNSSSGAYSFCGTPEYLAPEILNRQGHGRAVDWWSLGALLYEMLTGLPPFYCQDRERLFEKIRRSELLYPSSVSRPARSLLKGLLTKDPTRRLGSGPTDAKEIKDHDFFSDIDWDKLARGEIPPPWTPDINGILDTSQFDREFTSMPVFSPQSLQRAHGFGATPTNDNPFEGFTFTDRILHGPGAQAGH